ncbi:glycosyltransferase [Paraglaciecola sp.]|uniref:glycosyltransferase n=1 Tax=Paraglaciecola sp. TaxID=1920173 RepID=UPI003EF1B075
MDVIVTCEFRFYRTPDQKVWTNSAFLYQFWQRYLTSFERVIAVARIQDVETAETNWQLSSGDNVEFVALPYYVGFIGLLRNLPKIRQVINSVATPERGLIYRVPSQSAMLASFGRGKQYGYALEVVGDPFDVFNAGITNGLLDKILAWVSYQGLKRMANNALGSCYVTKEYLQRRYPVAAGALSVGCSDIELPLNSFVTQSKTYSKAGNTLVFVGSFAQLYKGPDLLIQAIGQLKKQGKLYHVTMLGGGLYLNDMKSLAVKLDCSELFHFVGEVGHTQVIQYLDNADLFVMPSRTEGLPRALIEAMARGLPCIASSVGGIPELLDHDYLVKSNNWQQLAEKLDVLLSSPQSLSEASRQNLLRSKNYEYDLLASQREAFYQSYLQLKKEFS